MDARGLEETTETRKIDLAHAARIVPEQHRSRDAAGVHDRRITEAHDRFVPSARIRQIVGEEGDDSPSRSRSRGRTRSAATTGMPSATSCRSTAAPIIPPTPVTRTVPSFIRRPRRDAVAAARRSQFASLRPSAPAISAGSSSPPDRSARFPPAIDGSMRSHALRGAAWRASISTRSSACTPAADASLGFRRQMRRRLTAPAS